MCPPLLLGLLVLLADSRCLVNVLLALHLLLAEVRLPSLFSRLQLLGNGGCELALALVHALLVLLQPLRCQPRLLSLQASTGFLSSSAGVVCPAFLLGSFPAVVQRDCVRVSE